MPYWIAADVTPEMNSANFHLQDKRQIVRFSQDEDLKLVIENIDSRKKFETKLPDEWARGTVTFFNIVDSLTIENSTLSVYQRDDKGAIIRQFVKKVKMR